MGDRFGDPAGVGFGRGPGDVKVDEVGDAFAVIDDLVGQRVADVASSLTPLAPLASRRTVSLVEVSPSMEMLLKLPSAASASKGSSSAGVASRSVKR